MIRVQANRQRRNSVCKIGARCDGGYRGSEEGWGIAGDGTVENKKKIISSNKRLGFSQDVDYQSLFSPRGS